MTLRGTPFARARASTVRSFLAELLERRTLLSVSLLKDINTNTLDSSPQDFTESGGLLYFSADDGQHGVELWKTDGTVAGTALVKDIDPRPVDYTLRWGPSDALPPLVFDQGSSYPVGLADVGGTLFFFAGDAEHGHELWKSTAQRPAR